MSDDLFALFQSIDDTPVVRETYVRAPFGYPGSKWRSLKNVLPKLPVRGAYCEPFGGTGCVLMSRPSCELEIFNDRYAGVVAFYRCIRDYRKCQEMVTRLEVYLHSREEFVWCRDTWRDCEDDVERATRWYYMTIMSFGQQGRNFGRCVRGRAQLGPKLRNNLELFHSVHDRMKDVQVENLDWRQCFKDFDCPEMVWYLDPTYFDYNKGMYEHEMSKDEHFEMCERIQHLQGFVALSGYENPLYNKYPWDDKHKWQVQVSMLGIAFTDTNNLEGKQDELKRDVATEVLWVRESKG